MGIEISWLLCINITFTLSLLCPAIAQVHTRTIDRRIIDSRAQKMLAAK